ncbi:hypothetical protein C5S30_01840 [ANME-1 cluster archaeon GoMg4]|nr:hypothetical protein [ANME-1 cluster archaeon GoMg4]
MGKTFYQTFRAVCVEVSLGMIIGNRYSDPECGFRALTRRVMEDMELKRTGIFVEAEMIAIAESNGFKTMEVPITEIYTEDGSTLNPWRHGFGNLGQAITYVSEKRPPLCVNKSNEGHHQMVTF